MIHGKRGCLRNLNFVAKVVLLVSILSAVVTVEQIHVDYF
jgi:hypothetical protein